MSVLVTLHRHVGGLGRRPLEIVKKTGLGHFGEQEGLQKGSGRPFRLFKYMGGGGEGGDVC